MLEKQRKHVEQKDKKNKQGGQRGNKTIVSKIKHGFGKIF